MNRAIVIVTLLMLGSYAETQQTSSTHSDIHLGFDRNDYPGDTALASLRRHFAFVGYWLTNPPGEKTNSWRGKRELLVKNGFGFLVLARGREDAEITSARNKTRVMPMAQGHTDAAEAVAVAKQEHFPSETIIFLDQEEGGRLTDTQLGYIQGWARGVIDGGYRPGVYASGQPVKDGPGPTITTAQDIRVRVDSELKHKVALWVYQDACPPSNGCVLHPPALSASGTSDAEVWQYAQSPRRKEITAACAKTYAADGDCYLADVPGIHLDLNVASSSDPSHGR